MPPKEHINRLKDVLKDDFYYIEDVKKIYKNLFLNIDVENINPKFLKSIGFTVLSSYIIKGYKSAYEYFKHLLTKDEIFDCTMYDSKLGRLTTYSQVKTELRKAYEIVAISNNEYITFSRLSKGGVTKKDIADYCNAAYKFLPPNTYFTIKSLRGQGFKNKLDDLGFDDIFYANILEWSPLYAYSSYNNNIILYNGDVGQTALVDAFVLSELSNYKSINIEDLKEIFCEKYGIKDLQTYDVKHTIVNTDFYYDEIMNKIYASKDYYYAEFDD